MWRFYFLIWILFLVVVCFRLISSSVTSVFPWCVPILLDFHTA